MRTRDQQRRAQLDGDARTPFDLAAELGHTDEGEAIRRFLRCPDDHRGPFDERRLLAPWHLTPEQAERVRERFT